MPMSSKWLFPSGFPTYFSSPPMRAAWPAHLILLDLIILYNPSQKTIRSLKCGDLASHVIKPLLPTERLGNPCVIHEHGNKRSAPHKIMGITRAHEMLASHEGLRSLELTCYASNQI
jgi:hypothetical protein